MPIFNFSNKISWLLALVFSGKGDAFILFFGRIKHFQIVSRIKHCFDASSDNDRVIEVLTFAVEKIRDCLENAYSQVKYIIIVFQFFQFNQLLEKRFLIVIERKFFRNLQ